MKNFTKCFSAFVLMLFTGIATAQNNPIVSYNQVYSNGKYVPNDSSYYTYNGQGKLTEQITVLYSNNTWDKSSRSTSIIDGQGKTLSTLLLRWENNAWAEYYKYSYTYNSNSLVEAILIEKKENGSWTKLSLAEYIYLPNNEADSVYNYSFNSIGNKTTSSRTKYNYGTSNELADRTTERWDASTSTWKLTAKWTYSYDFDGTLVKEEEDNYLGGGWVHIHHYKYTYDSDDKLRIKQHVNSATGEPIEKEGYKYAGEANFLSVQAPSATSAVNAYPNPANTGITISWEANAPHNVKITDMAGRVVENERNITTNTISFNCSALKQGFYVYTVENTDNGELHTGKLLIAH